MQKKELSTEILKKLIMFNTENPPGFTLDAANFIKNWLKNHNIDASVNEYEEGKANIYASIGPSDAPEIMMSGHLDTVPAGILSKWKYDPFSAVIEDGYMYGRGSADMKAGVAACLGCLARLKVIEHELEYKISFLGTFDEETGLKGATQAASDGILQNVERLIITEPTNKHIAIAEKGVLWMKVEAHGKSAHGSTPHLGINAIEGLTNVVSSLQNIVPNDKHNILGNSTLNLGMIKGGSAANVVPEYAEMELDIRFIPNVNPDLIIKKLEEIVRSNQTNVKLKIEELHRLPALETSPKNEFIEEFKKISKNQSIIGMDFATDAAALLFGCSQKLNTPFLIYGPGDPAGIHKENEKVFLDDVIEVENDLFNFIKNYERKGK